LEGDAIAVAFEQRPDRRRGETLTERRHDAAGDQDVYDRPDGWLLFSSDAADEL
jgi:hypothetical protein